jgi:hypothetical protein
MHDRLVYAQRLQDGYDFDLDKGYFLVKKEKELTKKLIKSC